jgi:hypothetical protein
MYLLLSFELISLMQKAIHLIKAWEVGASQLSILGVGTYGQSYKLIAK